MRAGPGRAPPSLSGEQQLRVCRQALEREGELDDAVAVGAVHGAKQLAVRRQQSHERARVRLGRPLTRPQGRLSSELQETCGGAPRPAFACARAHGTAQATACSGMHPSMPAVCIVGGALKQGYSTSVLPEQRHVAVYQLLPHATVALARSA